MALHDNDVASLEYMRTIGCQSIIDLVNDVLMENTFKLDSSIENSVEVKV
jgi:hypothetical protein